MAHRNHEIAHVELLSNIDNDPYSKFLSSQRELGQVGITTAVIRTLLDRVGSEGGNPNMAKVLFRAGFEFPAPSTYEIYGPEAHEKFDESKISDLRLYMGYLSERQCYANEEPDILTLTESFGRKPYSPYEEIIVSAWLNDSKISDSASQAPDDYDLGIEMLKQVITDDPTGPYESIVVAPSTSILRPGRMSHNQTAMSTVRGLGIKRKHYKARHAGRPRERLLLDPETVDLSLFSGEVELLSRLSQVFKSLKLEVETIDMEGGEHYHYSLTPIELNKVKQRESQFIDMQSVTSINVDIEDRPWDIKYQSHNLDEGPCYLNGWGDMTIDLSVERGLVTTTYSVTVYMDHQGREVYLTKCTNETMGEQDSITRMAGLMLSQSYATMIGEEDFNEVDVFEYKSLLSLLSSIAKCRQAT